MKPLGSEKLTGEDKIKRIIEIAQYKTNNVNESVSKTQYTKNAVDGNTYAIVKENDGYHVMVGLNESELDYVDGILNKNKYRFNFSFGIKKKQIPIIANNVLEIKLIKTKRNNNRNKWYATIARRLQVFPIRLDQSQKF